MSCAFYPAAPLLGMKRPKKRVIILTQIQWLNSTAKIWQTCKGPHFNKFLKRKNTNTLPQAPSSINKPKYKWNLSSVRCLSLMLLRCAAALLNPQVYSHPCTFMGVQTLCLGKPLFHSLLFPAEAISFLLLPGLRLLGKSTQWYSSVGSGCFSGVSASSPTLPCGSAAWASLPAADGGFGCCLCTSLHSFPVTTPRFSVEPEGSSYSDKSADNNDEFGHTDSKKVCT